MNHVEIKQRIFPCKPEWKIILEHLIYQDHIKLYRICRKMIIFLDRLSIPEISSLIEELNPSSEQKRLSGETDPNWPKPKGIPFDAKNIVDKVFSIADTNLSDEQITELLKQWLYQENINSTTMVLEKQNTPLNDVIDAVRKFVNITYNSPVLSLNERLWLRVSLIHRLLSENLNYINIAKHYISLDLIINMLDYIFGPAGGSGKLGGKSAGLILACQILEHKKKNNPLLENVKTPKSWFLTSDGLLEFVHYNALEEFVFTKYQTTEEIKQEYSFLEYIFKNSHFPPEFLGAFGTILDDLKDKPLVVRSSSLLEDSFEASFSGKYKSLFIANIGTKEERMSALMNAIAEVYASTFGPDPIEYRKERGLLDFREEMGILIQEVVGTRIGNYFLPSYAGVAFSNNEFRWSHRIRREDGVVRIVAGLGTRAVDRTINEYPTLVSPGQPSLKVNSSVDDKIRYSQQFVDVINLQTNNFETVEFTRLIQDCHGKYPSIEKIVSFVRSGMLIDPVSIMNDFSKEDIVVTFNNLIDKTKFIFQIKEILKLLQEAFKRPVDVEFASDGKDLYLLQCRPQSRFEKEGDIHIPANIPEEKKIFTANQYVSNGCVENIEFVVYVDSLGYGHCSTVDEMLEVGTIISRINRILPKRKFLLIGPGRWGSKGDIKLGVPVIYSDINNTAMLIEVAREKEGYIPDLSFGTHFFQDLVEANIKYLPLYPDKKGNIFNENFFYNSPNFLDRVLPGLEGYKDVIRVIRVNDIQPDSSLSVYMDGSIGQAVAFIS